MPSEHTIREIFSLLEDDGLNPTFFNHVADNVDWTLTGTDNPISGHHTSKADLFKAIRRATAGLTKAPPKVKIKRLVIAGKTVVAEMIGRATLKHGGNIEMEYCWICEFEGDIIVKNTAYQDSALMKRMIAEGKKGPKAFEGLTDGSEAEYEEKYVRR